MASHRQPKNPVRKRRSSELRIFIAIITIALLVLIVISLAPVREALFGRASYQIPNRQLFPPYRYSVPVERGILNSERPTLEITPAENSELRESQPEHVTVEVSSETEILNSKPSSPEIEVIPACPSIGDVVTDGKIDSQDLMALRNLLIAGNDVNCGSLNQFPCVQGKWYVCDNGIVSSRMVSCKNTACTPRGDFTGDGKITGSDVTILSAVLGALGDAGCGGRGQNSCFQGKLYVCDDSRMSSTRFFRC